MKLKLSGTLSKIVYALVAFCFLFALIHQFAGSFYGYSPLYLSVGTLAALALIVLFWRLVKKREAFFQKYGRYITAGFLVIMLALQLAFSFPLRYAPSHDIGALHGAAVEWANTGSFPSHYEYFAMFRNNFGGLILFRLWFGMMKLIGMTDYFFAACLLNSLLCIATMYLTASCAGKLFGIRGRMTALFLFFISLPFYFIAPAFYTDALTMIFPVLIFRLWLHSREQKKLIGKLACFVLMALACAAGFCIKATVIIMLIAVLIEGVLHEKAKAWLSLAAIAATISAAFMLAANDTVYLHVDQAQTKQKQIPVTHWIMMGLTGWGGYNSEDYEFTKSFDDPRERSEAIMERIGERVNALGFSGMLKLFSQKLDIVWNDGTYGLSDCLGCPHERDTFLHEFLVNKSGTPGEVYKHICTAVLAAMYLLLIASCVSDIFTNGATVRLLAPRLALLGAFIFFLFWEARWRYFSSFVPVIMLCAVTGLESFSAAMASRRKSAQVDKAEENHYTVPIMGEEAFTEEKNGENT